MNEKKLKSDYQNINKNIIDKVSNIIKNGDITNPIYKKDINELLRTIDYDYCNSIGEFVASICNVDRADILAKDKSTDIVHARCLWWYSLYFMLRKNYREISIISSIEDVEWSYEAVSAAITRIQSELQTDYVLQNKWDFIKKMIYIGKHQDAYDTPFSDTIGRKIKIYKPKNIEIEIENV